MCNGFLTITVLLLLATSLFAREDNTAYSPEALPKKGPYLSSVAQNSIIIRWRTATLDSSVVQYGLTAAYGNEEMYMNLKTAHSLELTGLLPDTIYHYRILFEGKQTRDYSFRTAVPSGTPFEQERPEVVSADLNGDRRSMSGMWSNSLTMY